MDVPNKQQLTVAMSATNAAQGLLNQWKKGAIDRKSLLESLQVQYTSALEFLKLRVQGALARGSSRLDKDYAAWVTNLDQDYLEVWAELGLHDLYARERAFSRLTE